MNISGNTVWSNVWGILTSLIPIVVLAIWGGFMAAMRTRFALKSDLDDVQRREDEKHAENIARFDRIEKAQQLLPTQEEVQSLDQRLRNVEQQIAGQVATLDAMSRGQTEMRADIKTLIIAIYAGGLRKIDERDRAG